MIDPTVDPLSVTATIGDISESQVAIGHHIIQVNARDGAVVKLAGRGRRARPKPRPLPVVVRPRPPAGFVDRQVETEQALATLRAAATVEVVGAAGMGKSALLRHLSHAEYGAALPDGVVHVRAAGRTVEDLLQLVHGHFFDAPPRYRPGEAELRQALAERRAVIVLDDIELDRDALSVLLDAVPRCAVLLAAPTRQGWGESQAVPLAGLPREHALVLLERELGRALEPDEQAAAAALWTRLKGHPLQLLQAAARARQAGVGLHELAEAAAPAGAAAPEQEHRSLLLLLAVAGELDMDALTELVGPHAGRMVEALVELQLVEVRDGAVHAVPSAAVAFTEEERAAARRRIVAYLVPWAEASRSDAAAIAARAPLLVRTVRGALAAGDAAPALRLARAIEPAFMLLGLWGSWRLLLEACSAAGRALGDTGAIEAWALHQLGVLDIVRGDAAGAAARFEAALRIRDALGDTGGAAVTRGNLRLLRGGAGVVDAVRELAGSGAAGRLAGAALAVAGGATLVWLFAFRTPDVRLVASAEHVDFAGQLIGTSSDAHEVRLTNESQFEVQFEPASVGSDEFRIVADGCAGALAPGTSCTIATAFAPSAAGYRSARLVLHAGRAVVPAVQLAGYGIALPDTVVATDTVAPPPPPPPDTTRPVDPPDIAAQDVDFGERDVGTTTIGAGTLSNRGGSAVRFGRLELTGDTAFGILEDGCSGRSVAAGAACTVEIAFRPDGAGPRAATLDARGADGALLSVLRIRGGGAAPPPPPPPAPARILRLVASPDTIEPGGGARICFTLADAVSAELVPPPDAGAVGRQPEQCVGVRPRRTTTYTLRASGLGGPPVERQVTVTVRALDRQPPGVPQRPMPGSTDAANSPPLQCPGITARWLAVSDPSTPVVYDVVLQHRSANRWQEIHRTRTQATTASFEDPVGRATRVGREGTYFFRWTVRAVDAAGNEGEFAPMRHFSCIVIL